MNTLEAIQRLHEFPPEIIEAGLQLLPRLNMPRVELTRVPLQCIDCGELHIAIVGNYASIIENVMQYSVCRCGSRNVIQL